VTARVQACRPPRGGTHADHNDCSKLYGLAAQAALEPATSCNAAIEGVTMNGAFFPRECRVRLI
jgi:hypothetical protein